jgi:hypothetical protein
MREPEMLATVHVVRISVRAILRCSETISS